MVMKLSDPECRILPWKSTDQGIKSLQFCLTKNHPALGNGDCPYLALIDLLWCVDIDGNQGSRLKI